MSELEFLQVMSFLGTVYSKEYTKEEIEVWYTFFKDYILNSMKSAIKKIVAISKYPPSISELLDAIKDNNKNNIYEVIGRMKDDGYFKKGSYGELSDEQALRNYEKILAWVDKGIIPEWFQEDMKDYMTDNKITTTDIKYLS